MGEPVRWIQEDKNGAVAEVVAAKSMPSRERFPQLYKGAGVGSQRDHESYVVLVANRPYWPRVKTLAKATTGT